MGNLWVLFKKTDEIGHKMENINPKNIILNLEKTLFFYSDQYMN